MSKGAKVMREQVTQLLEVLEIARKKVPPQMAAWQNHEDNFPLHILEIELGTDKPLCERLGVSKGVFPSVEELEEDELEVIVDKILELWADYHYYAEVLEGYPRRKAYTMLLSVWEEAVPMYATGGFHFDFYSEEDFEEDFDIKPEMHLE